MTSRDLPQKRWLAEVMRAGASTCCANNDVARTARRCSQLDARVPAVVHIRGMHVYEGGLPLLVDRRLAAGVRQHLAISGAVADLAVEQLHLDRDRHDRRQPVRPERCGARALSALARELGIEGGA
ncbi:MAG: hypothetical protein R2701_03385 [Acidimicrobiales bacterium]